MERSLLVFLSKVSSSVPGVGLPKSKSALSSGSDLRLVEPPIQEALVSLFRFA